MQRQIDAPDWEWGTAEQAASWLGIEAKAFKALVRDGDFPPPTVFNRFTRRWHWSVVYAASVLSPWLTGGPEIPPSEKGVKVKSKKSSIEMDQG